MTAAHIIDPEDSKKAVCGGNLTFHDPVAKPCVDCRDAIQQAQEQLPTAVMEEVGAKVAFAQAQQTFQEHSNQRLRLQRLVELGMKARIL
jgi:hypothetical protein